MEHVNWWVVLIIGIWLSAALGTAFSKDSQCVGAAMIVTIAIGIGYFLLRWNGIR